MKWSIRQTIYQAVLDDKWLDVVYLNRKGEQTHFFIGIHDIDISNGRVYCDIFNCFKSHETLKEGSFVSLSGIQSASIIPQSFSLTDGSLKKRLENERNLFEYLEADQLDNNILAYLSDCYKYDNDPFLKEVLVLDGIDARVLGNNRKYPLTEEQFALLLDKLYKKNYADAEQKSRFVDLAINSFSIDIKDKQYVVAYYKLSVDFKRKALHMDQDPTINQSFLFGDGQKVSLTTYLDMSPADFMADFKEHKKELVEQIQENYFRGEKTNTRPTFFLVERRSQSGVDLAFESISSMEREGTLTQPLKAFFGRNMRGNGTKKDPSIVVFDKTKVNIDQMRVVYNAMVNHITYVQGPPGTGKTETIFNVLLSSYANNKTVLVCSNNNHPIDDIMKRLLRSIQRVDPYTKQTHDVRLPVLRLGNMAEIAKAVRMIRDDLALAEKNQKIRTNEEATKRSKQSFEASFAELRTLLMNFEQRIGTYESIEKLKKFLEIGGSDRIKAEIQRQIEALQKKMDAIPYVKNEDLGQYMISASSDKAFQDYIHYSSLIRLKKLLSPINQDLRDVLALKDDEEAASEFTKYLKDDKNLKHLLDIYPIILCTNLSCDKLGSAVPAFDLCIMDEAGQCNVATSLIPIVRCKELLLVGDTNQLQPVTVIEPTMNDKLKAQYGVRDDYDYMHNSILSCMRRKDENSKSILLRYHYRCGKKIASFSNQRFYDGELKLENITPGNLVYLGVHNHRYVTNRNSYVEEASAIVDIVEKGGYKDVAIITPFVNQASLINAMLKEKGIAGVSAGTIHTLQGSEKTTIIFSAAISPRTGKKTMDWVKNNHELINVGVTRAKETFIFVGDREAINSLSGAETNDIKALSDYVASQGECIVPKIEGQGFSDFSNDSTNEKEFFETIAPYFNGKKNSLRIERNVPVSKAIKGIATTDLQRVGKKEFDVIVQARGGILRTQYRTIVAFEIDGGEHVGSKSTAARDRVKEDICASYHVKLIRVANSQVKDYELIISMFEAVIKGLPDIEAVYEQGSLFDDTGARP